MVALTVLPDDPARTADHGYFPGEAAVRDPNFSDTDILVALRDMFAGKRETVLGQNLEWWSESFQCDMPPEKAAGVVVAAFWGECHSPDRCDDGIETLRLLLLLRARILIAKSLRDTGKAVL
ncbi:hypothetical protein WHX56_14020 [Achromobacter veterisilvae]|uniref:Uncharacterized protein n=1 Tax=Achromobacter veterisilvae TaxID=2069367 RepID=A0ABZ2S8W3_9BURK